MPIFPLYLSSGNVVEPSYEDRISVIDFSILKVHNVTPLHKGEDRTLKMNFRVVSILPVLSKLFGREMNEQMYEYMENFLSDYLFGYRSGYGPQYCLVAMIEM